MNPKMNLNRTAANALVHFGFVITGAVTTLLGPILPILMSRWSMNDERAGLLFTLQFCGSFAGVVSFSALVSRLGYGRTLIIGFACIAAGVGALSWGGQHAGLAATAGFGYGLGLVLSSTNLWVAEIAGPRRASALSILNLAWGTGAVACPILVFLARRGNSLTQLLLGIAIASACTALALTATDIEPRKGLITSRPLLGRSRLLTNKRTIFALGALFFLYVGTESSVGGWAAAFAKRTGFASGHLWELVPMFFWGGLLTGRALAPIAVRRVSLRALLTAGLALSGICTGALLLTSTARGTVICVAGAGLGCSCIYPLLVAWMAEHFGEQARQIGSFVFALASFGGATMPWLVGFVSTRRGTLRAGLLVPLAACLIMIGLWTTLPAPSLQSESEPGSRNPA